MAKTLYDLLNVSAAASADEIKRAFRREIAKYHPDKVQHLGQEFQEIAATKAAELTSAYKTLTDPAARAEYDASDAVLDGYAPPQPAPPAAATTASAPSSQSYAPPSAPTGASSAFSQDRAGANDLVQRATVIRFRTALNGEFGRWDDAPLAGFEVTCVPKPPFWSLKLPPRVLGRFVPHVDGPALTEAWALAARLPKDSQRELCVVFVMGPSIAPAGDLAVAINEQRRKPAPAPGKLIVVPVNTRSWAAHVPTDAPPVVKSLLTRLKAS